MIEKDYDLKQLRELAAGSEDFVDSMVETFLEHTPGQLDEMMEAYKNGNLLIMGGIAHKIKPNIDLFEISSIADEIRLVEKKGKTEENDEDLKHGIYKVEEVLRKVFAQLRSR